MQSRAAVLASDRACASSRPRFRARSTSRARRRRPRPGPPARDHREGFAAGPLVVPARRARRLHRLVRLDGAGTPSAGPQHRLDGDSQTLTPGHPVTLTTQSAGRHSLPDEIAVDDGYLFTVQQSVANGSAKPVTFARTASSAAPTSPPTRRAGPTMSARSAAQRQGRLRRQLEGPRQAPAVRWRAASPLSAAGWASPTNTG